jgi:hypothetical protein
MPRAGLELATPATEPPQTYALDGAAPGVGVISLLHIILPCSVVGHYH